MRALFFVIKCPLHSLHYGSNGLKLWIFNLEICIDNYDRFSSNITQLNKINEGVSNRKLPKVVS